MTNDKAIELIKDEYCSDCVWKDESEDFLKHAYVKCAKCGKELKYGLNLPRNCEFLHLCDDGKLRVDPQENEPYCCDCIIELQGGGNNV